MIELLYGFFLFLFLLLLKILINIRHFHRIGPLGRFGLVVAMYVLMYLCCPLPMGFFCVVDWCGASLARGLVRSVNRPHVEP